MYCMEVPSSFMTDFPVGAFHVFLLAWPVPYASFDKSARHEELCMYSVCTIVQRNVQWKYKIRMIIPSFYSWLRVVQILSFLNIFPGPSPLPQHVHAKFAWFPLPTPGTPSPSPLNIAWVQDKELWALYKYASCIEGGGGMGRGLSPGCHQGLKYSRSAHPQALGPCGERRRLPTWKVHPGSGGGWAPAHLWRGRIIWILSSLLIH
jgi:hypothetical protein